MAIFFVAMGVKEMLINLGMDAFLHPEIYQVFIP
jgi:hypothetical protein